MNHKLNDRLSVNARVSYDQMKVYGMGTSEGGDRFNKMQHNFAVSSYDRNWRYR